MKRLLATATILSLVLTSPAFSQILIPDRGRRPAPHSHLTQSPRLPMTRWDMSFQAVDGWVELASEQTFHNSTNGVLEATYLLPLPRGAVANNLELWINGKPVNGEVLSSDKAAAVYQSIVRRMRDPALLEYAGRDLLKARIFPIQPRTDAKVRVKLVWTADRVGSLFACEMPLTSPEGNPSFTLRADLQSSTKLGAIFSPSHPLDVVRKGDQRAVASYEGKLGDHRRLTLYYGTNSRGPDVSLLAHKSGPLGHFLLTLFSPKNPDAKRLARDVVFVLDRSGSMKDGKLEQAVEALKHGISTLDSADRFEVVSFATEPFPLFNGLSVANDQNRAIAAQHLQGLRAAGGTALAEAVTGAVETLEKSERMRVVVLLTDGEPTIGETDPGKIVAQVAAKTGKTRVFCFGVGHDVNPRLLDHLAENGKGASDYVLPNENLELRVSTFFDRVSQPVLENLSLEIRGQGENVVKVQEVYPKEPGDLFAGSAIHLLGLYSGSGAATVILRGNSGSGTVERTFEVQFPEHEMGHDSIRPLYASRKVAYLLNQIHLHGIHNELKEEIIRLGREYGIVTPYTSALVVEEGEALALSTGIRGGRGGNFFEARRRGRLEADDEVLARLRTLGQLEAGREGVERAAELKRYAGSPASPAGLPQRDAFGLDSTVTAGEALSSSRQVPKVRHAAGKTFLRGGETWIDRSLDMAVWDARVTVESFSQQYFELLRKQPELRAYASLGLRVIVQVKGQVYVFTEPSPEEEAKDG